MSLFYGQQPTSIPLDSELPLRCPSRSLQPQWRLCTFVRKTVCEETITSFSPSSDNTRSIMITSEQAYISTLNVILTVTFAVVQAVNLSCPALSTRQTNIEIVAGGVHRRTQSVKWKKDKITQWDSKLDL